jgi:hypothetical protein
MSKEELVCISRCLVKAVIELCPNEIAKKIEIRHLELIGDYMKDE